MLKKLESLVNSSPFYNLIRFNPLTDFIIEVLHKKVGNAVNFYSEFLKSDQANKLIFDIGANKGNKVLVLLKLGFNVIAVEPEKKSISTLEWRFKNNSKFTLVTKGVSKEVGKLTMYVTEARSGLNTLSDKWVDSLENQEENRWSKTHSYKNSYEVEVTTLDILMEQFGTPYYIKIDVEGFELNVIKGMKKTPTFLSFETNLPEFLEDTLQIINTLNGMNDTVRFNYSTKDTLVLEKWIDAKKMIEIISSTTERYMEIICNFKTYERD